MKVEITAFIMTTRRGVDRLAQMAPRLSTRDSVSNLKHVFQAAPENLAAAGKDVWLNKVSFTYTSHDETTDARLIKWVMQWIDGVMKGLTVHDAQVVVKR